MNKQINILIIGMGNHARRIYIPTLIKMSKDKPITVVGVDMLEYENVTKKALLKSGLGNFPAYFVGGLSKRLSKRAKNQLDELVNKHKINAVVISTPPDSHKTYALWAIENGLHILMDKPITTRKNCSTNGKQAKELVADYKEITKKYEDSYKTKKTIFMLNTQRRYEIGYLFAFDLIKEVSEKFGMPVTSIQSMHADGVWIFPDEIVEQTCHNYYDGCGKCSHSGFHLFDIVWQFYKAGYVKDKFANSAEVFSSFVEPRGLLKQFSQSDYRKLFGEKYDKQLRRSNKQLEEIYEGYGENDAFSTVRLLKDSDNICNISINLMHNSVSERSWIKPSYDLYKKNGRIKHQHYFIQQGPFQSIQIHNYQSKSMQDNNDAEDYEVGGNNHFDIYVFRNPNFFGKNTKNFSKYSLKDLDFSDSFDDSRLYHEITKEKIVNEFVNAILGKVSRNELKTDISTYLVPVQIMSAIYHSNSKYKKGLNPLIKFNINEKE